MAKKYSRIIAVIMLVIAIVFIFMARPDAAAGAAGI